MRKGGNDQSELRSRERLIDYNRGRSRPFAVFQLTSLIRKHLLSRKLRKQELTTGLTQELTQLELAIWHFRKRQLANSVSTSVCWQSNTFFAALNSYKV
jgi:hypothetical protein